MCHKCGDTLTPYEACCAPEPLEECPCCGAEIDDTIHCEECGWYPDDRTEAEILADIGDERYHEERENPRGDDD